MLGRVGSGLLATLVATSLVSTAHAQPAPPPTPPPASVASRGAPATVVVSITTTKPNVMLERRIGSMVARPPAMRTGDPAPGDAPPAYAPPNSYGPYWESDWERVCRTPCHQPIAVAGEYRIAGDGITPSDSFPLKPGGRMIVDVDPGSSSLRGLGNYMAVFGFLLAGASAVFLVMSLSSNEKSSQDENHLSAVLSGVGLGTGALVGIVGLGFVAGTGTTVKDGAGKEIGRRTLLLGGTGRF